MTIHINSKSSGKRLYILGVDTLEGFDFSGYDLRGANLSNADLSNADFCNANLSGANLSNANLSNANFSKANFSEAECYNATFLEANLSHANLSNANLAEANLSEANLSEADCYKANLSKARVYKTNLSKAKLDYKIEKGLLRKIAEIVLKNETLLCMDKWHSACGTAHCIAGWAVTLGKRGRVLEELYGTPVAGLLLLGPEAHSHFYDSNEEAKNYLQSVLNT